MTCTFVKHPAMWPYGSVEVKLHSFLISTLIAE